MTDVGMGAFVWTIAVVLAGLPQPPPPPLPVSTLPLRLTGVIVDEHTPSRSASLIHCSNREEGERFVAGEQVCDLAQVIEIRPDGLVIRNLLTNRLELLAFRSEPPSTAAPPPPPRPVVAASSDGVAVDLASGTVEYYLGNLPEILESALATPRYREGAKGQRSSEGFEIGRVKQGGIVEQLGLRDGDVILEVNGQPLDSLATVVRIVGQMRDAPRATATVLRDGRRLTFVFTRALEAR